jgi:uncharacterized damage-inducible protein DinB
MTLLDTFGELARYNRWANARLYQAALVLPNALYRRDAGVFFRSLHGTLNHLLLADRVWLMRLTGEGRPPNRLDEILYEDLIDLTRARAHEDDRLIRLIGSYEENAFARLHAYQMLSGKPQEQPLADILLHVFNHQAHHRGQAHACLSIVTGSEPPALDLLLFQRGLPAPDLAELASNAPSTQGHT